MLKANIVTEHQKLGSMDLVVVLAHLVKVTDYRGFRLKTS